MAQQTVTKAKAKAKQTGKSATKSKTPTTLWYFADTMGGKMLRAYFLAYICAQLGKLAVDVPFKLLPANFSGHTRSGKMIYKGADRYTLTTAGYNYFTDPEQAAQPDLYDAMYAAVTTGKPPAFYKHEMIQQKLS